MRLFLYGSLLAPAVLARRAGRPGGFALNAAWLDGWRRVAIRGGRWPTLRRARAVVRGAVAEVDAAALRRLGAYEGPRYRLRRVTARGARDILPAFAWIAPEATRRAR
jgi:gamma-glutamylcyclotransferase (GGCT)/AIG2-like uncharacterized protein YtfP